MIVKKTRNRGLKSWLWLEYSYGAVAQGESKTVERSENLRPDVPPHLTRLVDKAEAVHAQP